MYHLFIAFILLLTPVSAQQQYDFFIDDAAYSQNKLENELLQYDQRENRPTLEYDGVTYSVSVFNNFQYDTNIFSVAKNSQNISVEDDFINTLSTSFSAATDFGPHKISMNAGISDQRYISYSQENALKYNISGFGNLQLSNNDSISLNASYNKERENRNNIFGSQISEERIAMNNIDYNIRYNKILRRTRISLQAGVVDRDFEDGLTSNNQNIDQDFRDFTRYALLGRTDYAISSEVSLLGLIELNKTHANNDSEGINYAIGANVNITDFINLETKIGYFMQNFSDTSLNDTTGVLIDTNLTYYVTPLTELSLNVSLDRDQQAFANANDIIRRNINTGLKHKLTRYITLSGYSDFTQQDLGSVAKVKTYNFGLGAEYLVGDHIYMTLDNTFSFQQSDDVSVNRDFKKNIIMAGIKVTY